MRRRHRRNRIGRAWISVSHEEWDAVGDLPGRRIEIRMACRKGRYDIEYFEDGESLERPDDVYTLSRAGLDRLPRVLPWPQRRRKEGWFQLHFYERLLSAHLVIDFYRPRWSVLKILELGEPLVTLRWTEEAKRWWGFGLPQYMQ